MADRALCAVQLGRSGREIEMTRRHGKDVERIERWKTSHRRHSGTDDGILPRMSLIHRLAAA
jgi:hypothetical protein